jgi:hypothetical protein
MPTTPYLCPYEMCNDPDEEDVVDEDDEDFTNEDCPGRCSTDHEVGDSYTICEETGTSFVNCYHCGWTEDHGNSEYIRGRLYCDPSDHGYSSCEGCGDWSTDLMYSDRRDQYYCSDCYPDDENGEPAMPKPYQSCCGKQAQHFDLVTERYICDCTLRVLLQGKPFHPVKVSSVPAPVVPPPPPGPQPPWRRAPQGYICTVRVNGDNMCLERAIVALTGRHSEEAACGDHHQRVLAEQLGLVTA